MALNFSSVSKVFISGIGGIGVSAVAQWLQSQNKIVCGSDLAESEITAMLQQKGIKIYFRQTGDHITDDYDLYIYSAAVPEDNSERMAALAKKIPSFSYPQFLGELSRQKKVIAISGTKGKTTTTALISVILEKAGFDPTCIVGSKLNSWGTNFRAGSSDWLVVEACEYRAHMLHLKTDYIVLTNLEAEHLDYYKDLRDIEETFQKFILANDSQGTVVLNNDNSSCQKLAAFVKDKITYALNVDADFKADNIIIKNGCYSFNVTAGCKNLGRFILPLPGLFNIYNALAAIALSVTLGVSVSKIKQAIKEFSGIWRRYHFLGNFQGAKVITDYAHTPTSVYEIIKAAKIFNKTKNIVAVFQPHQHARTKKLFFEFADAFVKAAPNKLILTEIYEVKGREDQKDQDVSSLDLVKEIGKKGQSVLYCGDFEVLKDRLKAIIGPKDLLLFIGAGDIYEWAVSLVK